VSLLASRTGDPCVCGPGAAPWAPATNITRVSKVPSERAPPPPPQQRGGQLREGDVVRGATRVARGLPEAMPHAPPAEESVSGREERVVQPSAPTHPPNPVARARPHTRAHQPQQAPHAHPRERDSGMEKGGELMGARRGRPGPRPRPHIEPWRKTDPGSWHAQLGPAVCSLPWRLFSARRRPSPPPPRG